MTQKRWAYEDMVEGMVLDLGSRVITADEIIEFASEFDNQPMHLDEQAGRESLLGGLAASGWHSCAIYMRMLCDAMISDSTAQGAPGVDFVKWRRPVLAGDRLSGRCTVVSRRLSQSRPGLGLVLARHEMSNQHGDVVLEMQNTVMMLTRRDR
ncbi:MAG: MaoC family dehydratase [Rhizobiaceae bacterium]|nr:MaoC family dehydratase [Rhizobiaceae bacterium]